MINQARTLLLNQSGSGNGFTNQPGEEFIPPEFRKQKLPGPLAQVWQLLFGSQPDRYLLNYRARELLGLLHSTELVEFVTSPDPRITYDVLPSDVLFERMFRTRITPLDGTTSPLFPVGTLPEEDTAGRLQNLWLIDVLSGNTVEVRRLSPPPSSVVSEYALTNGLSNRIPLFGSTMAVMFQAGVGSRWRLEIIARPKRDLADIFQDLQSLAGSALPTLFARGRPAGRSEPLATCWALWKQHPQMPYRLSGLLTAWILQADHYRNQGQLL